MGAPQITMIVLYALSLVITVSQHGQPKTGNHNIFLSMVGAGIGLGIMYWGGFFS